MGNGLTICIITVQISCILASLFRINIPKMMTVDQLEDRPETLAGLLV